MAESAHDRVRIGDCKIMLFNFIFLIIKKKFRHIALKKLQNHVYVTEFYLKHIFAIYVNIYK